MHFGHAISMFVMVLENVFAVRLFVTLVQEPCIYINSLCAILWV